MDTTPLATAQPTTMSRGLWIHNPRWDLTFLSLSVLLVPIPYLVWLFMRDQLGVDPEFSRQLVNILVILAVAGPHTYATFSRTLLDDEFRSKHHTYYLSSFLIPIIVIVLALVNLPLLLTIFFFWASLHTWHQIIFVIDAYHEKEHQTRRQKVQWRLGQFIDYGPILVGLYPIAAYRIAITQDFSVGPTRLNDVIPSLFEQPWLFLLAISIFVVCLIAFLIKSGVELARGTANLTKIAFIMLTVVAFFFIPSLDNLDTALQGINVWHCTQYLALTWFINRLRVQRGEMQRMPFLRKLAMPGHARGYYLFNLGLTLGSMLLIVLFYFGLSAVGGKWSSPLLAFETAYYIGILGFLWIHYYHDHFLFTQPESLLTAD